MTAVFSNPAAFSADFNNILRLFTIEVVTFDQESHTVEVEATNADTACSIAAAQVDNADYTMVQFVEEVA